MKCWLVGEANPYGDDPRFDLYPWPPGSAGGRLRRILDLDEDEYLEAFERRNLLRQGRCCAPAARAAADALLEEHPEDHGLVLLGAKVAAAFGRPFREVLFVTHVVPVGCTAPRERAVLVVPHPSGLSRDWNDPTAAPKVRAAVDDLRRRTTTHQ